MAIRRYMSDDQDWCGFPPDLWMVTEVDHLFALRSQREGIAEMARKMLYHHKGQMSLEDKMDVITAILAYGGEEEKNG